MKTVALGRSRVVHRPGPAYSSLGSIRAIRRLGLTGFFDAIHRDHPRLAYVRFGSKHAYLVFEPDLIRAVLVDQGRASRKGRGLERSKELLGEGLLTSEGEHHRRQRRLVQPAFHASRIATYAEVMCEEARLLSAGWRHGACVDMSTEMSRLTLRIVGRSLFGTELSAADLDTVSRALSTFLARFELLMMPGATLLGRLPTRANLRLRAERAELDALIYRLIAEHRETGDTGDLLSMLLLSGAGTGEQMSDRQIRDEALTLMLAGHETTANALTWAWLLLAGDRPATIRLHREVDALNRSPASDDLDALPFSRAVIAESMRLYPPAWSVGRRAVEPLTIDGYTVPAGSLIEASQWVVHRDPQWWDEAPAFRPERWIDADGQFADPSPRGAYFPFGAGRRVCIGESFAWTEAVLVLATLAQDWIATSLPETSLETRPAMTLRPADGAPLRLRYRR
jgi:cytochrome P450